MVPFDKLDSFYGESEDDESGSWSAGTCAFPFLSDEYVGRVDDSFDHVSDVGSGVCPDRNRFNWRRCSVGCVCTKKEFSPKVVNSQKYFAAQNLDFPS